jgi:hypothetical protein
VRTAKPAVALLTAAALRSILHQIPQHKLDDLRDIFSFLDVEGNETIAVSQLGKVRRQSA